MTSKKRPRPASWAEGAAALLALLLVGVGSAQPRTADSEGPHRALFRRPANDTGAGTGTASPPQAWPASYRAANAPPGRELTLRGESFTVYSRPMVTRYADVYNERQAPIPLPPEIVARFNGSVMAIAGFDIDVVRLAADGVTELSVPSRDFYNHHYILGLRSSLFVPPASMDEGIGGGGDDEEAAAGTAAAATAAAAAPGNASGRHRFPLPSDRRVEEGADAAGLLRRERQPGRRPRPPAVTAASPLRPVSAAISEAAETIPLIQVFCEANGGEYRQSFHGYPRGYAQLIKSPQSFWPFQLHFINTRAAVGRLEPAASRAPPGAAYSGLIECPCTTRRVKDHAAQTIDGRPVSFDCRGEVLRQNNTVCGLGTYQGGYRCCEGGMVLLDESQTQPEGADSYRLKVRFWYEPYHEEEEQEHEDAGGGPLSVVRASHAHLFRFYLQTEQMAGEYDVPACNASTSGPEDCVHVLTSINRAEELFTDCSFVDGKECADIKALRHAGGFKLIYAAGHLHVGGISIELYNADTGELLCRQVPEYVDGYVERIPPCLWSDLEEGQDGGSEAQARPLRRPPVIRPETRLLSIAKYDSRGGGHLGVMASWQCRASYLVPGDGV